MFANCVKLIITTLLFVPHFANAQRSPRPPIDESRRLDRLERAVENLQDEVYTLGRRVSYLEDLIGNNPLPPPQELTHVCLIIDSGYSKAFVGIGKTKIDAEFQAQQNCAKGAHPTYCTGASAKMKCDDTLSSRGRGFVCVVTDTGYGKVFRGEGITAVAAEGAAKQACQAGAHPTYCGNVTARCEEQF